MKKLLLLPSILLLLVAIILSSCCEPNSIVDFEKVHSHKIDSVLYKVCEKYNLSTESDKQIQETWEFRKSVYDARLHITLEFYKYYDSHNKQEIIVCYDDSMHYFGIPFIDNMELMDYCFDKSDTILSSSLGFESNAAVQFFNHYNQYANSKELLPAFMQDVIVVQPTIIENILLYQSVYWVRKCYREDSVLLINILNKGIADNHERNDSFGISETEKDKELLLDFIRNYKYDRKLYYFINHNVMYLIKYGDLTSDNPIQIEFLNEQNYKDMIW